MTEQPGNGSEDYGSRLLRLVEAIAISPDDAKAIAQRYIDQSKTRYPRDDNSRHQLRAADKIIGRYSKLAAMVGSASALPGVVPVAGTAIAVGGAGADVAISMKLQVDMCMCMAAAFEYDLTSEDGKHLIFLIAATGAVERMGVPASVKLGSTAGVRMLRAYLKGAALQAAKHAFRKAGITFTRKALERAIPFGVGVGISGAANYGLTRFVGRQAKEWFVIDQTMDSHDAEDDGPDGAAPSPPESPTTPPQASEEEFPAEAEATEALAKVEESGVFAHAKEALTQGEEVLAEEEAEGEEDEA